MPLYDYQCPVCGTIVELLVMPGRRQPNPCCKTCSRFMPRIMAAPAKPIIKGFSADNGYSWDKGIQH